MGRKNANARRRYRGSTYGSFEELKIAGVKFDLTGADFITRDVKRKVASVKDVGISFNNSGGRLCASVSIVAEKADKIGEYAKIGIVKYGTMERLYIVGASADEGYTISKNTHTRARRYLTVPIDEAKKTDFEQYCGDHELRYDYDNDAYYITKYS